jgi:hypothetical protein
MADKEQGRLREGRKEQQRKGHRVFFSGWHGRLKSGRATRFSFAILSSLFLASFA